MRHLRFKARSELLLRENLVYRRLLNFAKWFKMQKMLWARRMSNWLRSALTYCTVSECSAWMSSSASYYGENSWSSTLCSHRHNKDKVLLPSSKHRETRFENSNASRLFGNSKIIFLRWKVTHCFSMAVPSHASSTSAPSLIHSSSSPRLSKVLVLPVAIKPKICVD